MEFTTAVLHGSKMHYANGATLPPINQVSAFEHDSMEELEKIFAHKASGFAYTRIGNPTVMAFEQRVAALEKGIGAVATASGMSAIAQTFLSILSSGDEIVASKTLYGGTIELFAILRNLGISVKTVNPFSSENIKNAITPKTKLVFGEVISNPALEITDIADVAQTVHSFSIPLVLDSTTATPYLCNPLSLGADIVIHSSSKYINGSSDAISGIVVDGGKFSWDKERYPSLAPFCKYGKLAFLVRLREQVAAEVGACLAPFNAYLNIIGLETLALRMNRICENAHLLAKEISKIEGIEVRYPLLETSPYKTIAENQLKNFGGGILTLRVGSKERAFKIINSLKYAKIASNIGDVRTLVIHPASTLYIHNTKDEMNDAGVFEDTIRVSVGIEESSDLIEDFVSVLKNG